MPNENTTEMPSNFPYLETLLQGKPEHSGYDPFCARHPKMDRGKRAKIFAPFDALKGFSEEVASKTVIYTERVQPGEDAQEEIDRSLRELSRLARQNRGREAAPVRAEVTFFEVCRDPHSEAFGVRGQYHTVCGAFRGIDPEGQNLLLLDRYRIPLEDILTVKIL